MDTGVMFHLMAVHDTKPPKELHNIPFGKIPEEVKNDVCHFIGVNLTHQSKKLDIYPKYVIICNKTSKQFTVFITEPGYCSFVFL